MKITQIDQQVSHLFEPVHINDIIMYLTCQIPMLEISRKKPSRNASIGLFNLVNDEIREPDPEKADFLFVSIFNPITTRFRFIVYVCYLEPSDDVGNPFSWGFPHQRQSRRNQNRKRENFVKITTKPNYF